jgi:hypothetical protein
MRFAPRGLASNRSRQPRGCDSSPPLRASAAGTPACDSPNHAPGSALSGEARRRQHSSGAGCSAWALQHPPPNPQPPRPFPLGGRGARLNSGCPRLFYTTFTYILTNRVSSCCATKGNLFLPRITHRPVLLYPVSTPFISRASHPSARGPNRVVANDTQLTIATAHRVWYDGKQPRPEVCSSLMKAGFPTICGQRVRGDSMPIAASATCSYQTPCAPWPALRRQEVGCLRQGSGRKLFRGPKNCQPPLQPIVAKGEKRPQQS